MIGHTESCANNGFRNKRHRCNGECVRLERLENEGKGECQECGEEFVLDENPVDCPHCGEIHGWGNGPDSHREDFHSDG